MRSPLARQLSTLLLGLALCAPAAADPTKAPPWSLKTPTGDVVNYPADAHGQPTVLLFWPSWCPFSRALQPYVQAIWEDYRDVGVNVWTINIKETGDPVQTMRDRGLSFPLLLDGDSLVYSYGIVRTPWFVVIDGKGNIVYTRPPSPPSPIDVAKAARAALNQLLGPRAVPLPTSYPPPYDLHLRKEQPSRLASDAVSDDEWRSWAQQYLATVPADERVEGQKPRGAIGDGKTAIRVAREVWSEAFGPEQTLQQAPFRAYRRNHLWVVSGTAVAGRLGEGYQFVIQADDGQVVRVRGIAESP